MKNYTAIQIADSLAQILQQNPDLNFLRRCPNCQIFHLTNNRGRDWCSDKCNDDYNNEKKRLASQSNAKNPETQNKKSVEPTISEMEQGIKLVEMESLKLILNEKIAEVVRYSTENLQLKETINQMINHRKNVILATTKMKAISKSYLIENGAYIDDWNGKAYLYGFAFKRNYMKQDYRLGPNQPIN